MYTELINKERRAKKQHSCDWCGRSIQKGDVYNYQKYIYDGSILEWHAHLACSRVVTAIWDYADPDEGMNSDEFYENCSEVCREFICPDCPAWDKKDADCVQDRSFCVDKMDEFFMDHELYRWKRNGINTYWRCREKEKKRNETL